MKLQVEFTGFKQELLLNQKPFVAKIFEGRGKPPEGFNTLCISVDVSDCSLLQWQEAHLLAQTTIQEGFYILWELTFALLEGSLEDEARFLTFELNLQHFCETLLKPYQDHSLGVVLYRGEFHEELIDYLKSLAAMLDGETSAFLFLDTSSIHQLDTYLQVINQERYGHMHLFLKGHFAEKFPWAKAAFAWGHSSSALGFCASTLKTTLSQAQIRYALLLSESMQDSSVEQVMEAFCERPLRVIFENLLIYEWEGIETLLVFPHALSEKAMRKIKGFMAAGGEIIKIPDDAASLQLQGISLPSCPAFLR